MSGEGPTQPAGRELSRKIARLAQERGWNQADLARNTGLTRHTARSIMRSHEHAPRHIHNATLMACARALGVSVLDLRTLSVEQLLARRAGRAASPEDELLARLAAGPPEVRAWADREPERARKLSADEAGELLSLPASATAEEVTRSVAGLERRQELFRRFRAVMQTADIDFLEQFVNMLYERTCVRGIAPPPSPSTPPASAG